MAPDKAFNSDWFKVLVLNLTRKQPIEILPETKKIESEMTISVRAVELRGLEKISHCKIN